MGSDDWCSPPEVTVPLAEFSGGEVDVDPCSNKGSIVRAREAYTWGGLHRPWGKKTYENPPYSATGVWTDRAIAELASGNVVELIRLTMVATSTVWWERQCTATERNPRLLFTSRLAFLPIGYREGDRRESARFDTVVTYYGPRVDRFERCFSLITRWSAWGR